MWPANARLGLTVHRHSPCIPSTAWRTPALLYLVNTAKPFSGHDLHITAIFLWLLHHALTNNTADNVDDDPDTVTAGDTESEAATPESVAEQAGAAQVSATFLKISNLIPSVSGQPKQGGAQPSCCVASQPATLSEEDGRGESALRAVT